MGGFSANAEAALAKRVWSIAGKAWISQLAGDAAHGAGAATLWQIWHSGQVPQWDWLESAVDEDGSAWAWHSSCIFASALAATFCIAAGCCTSISMAITSPTQPRKGSKAIMRTRRKRRIQQ